MPLDIRPMTEAEVSIAIDWAAAEGWNPGLSDLRSFRAEDPDGFLMGRLDGKPAATISVVRYGTGYAFLGFFIVAPELRGQGHGLAIWQVGMERLAGRCVGLDGVVAQQGNYAKSGFVLAYPNFRHGGRVKVEVPRDARLVANPAAAAVAACDRACFPEDRIWFLKAWLGEPGHVVRALVEDGTATGYGVLRPSRDGSRIGPLFAADRSDAEVLFCALAAEAPDGPVFMDLPEPNRDAFRLAETFGLAPCFETARMYRGPAPDLPLGRIFGITSLELG